MFGEDLRTLRGRGLAEYRSRTLGYADQHYTRALAPELTARQLVALRLALLGAPAPETARAADALLERVGLLDRRDAPPVGALGRPAAAGCDLRRARRIVRASSSPTSRPASSTPSTRPRSTSSSRELSRDTGVTTIVVSHDPESARVADRVVQIRDGRVSAESRAGEHAEAVVNRGGWIRLPEELVGDTAQSSARARARRDPRAG